MEYVIIAPSGRGKEHIVAKRAVGKDYEYVTIAKCPSHWAAGVVAGALNASAEVHALKKAA